MADEASKRAHYERNKERYIAQARAKKIELTDRLRAMKEASPCEDCNEFYPAVCMDYDHRDGESKVNCVSRLINNCCWQKVLDEIEKCDLVCANCHRIRTLARREEKSECGGSVAGNVSVFQTEVAGS